MNYYVPLPSELAEMPRLEGARVVLRPMQPRDVAVLFELFSDPRVMRYWSRLPMRGEDEARELYANALRGWRERTHLAWAIAAREEERLVGTCTLFAFRADQGRAVIGYALHPSLWRQGLAREVVRMAIGYGFGPLALRRIEADVDPRNEASVRLLETLGFVREGLLRENWRVGDEVSDSAIYGLLKRDWDAARG